MRDYKKLRAFQLADELAYPFSLAARLGFVKTDDLAGCAQKLEETEKVLGALVRSLR